MAWTVSGSRSECPGACSVFTRKAARCSHGALPMLNRPGRSNCSSPVAQNPFARFSTLLLSAGIGRSPDQGLSPALYSASACQDTFKAMATGISDGGVIAHTIGLKLNLVFSERLALAVLAHARDIIVEIVARVHAKARAWRLIKAIHVGTNTDAPALHFLYGVEVGVRPGGSGTGTTLCYFARQFGENIAYITVITLIEDGRYHATQPAYSFDLLFCPEKLAGAFVDAGGFLALPG